MDASHLPGRIAEAMSVRDIEALVDCFSTDYRAVLPLHPARSFIGNDRVRANNAALFERLPDLHARVLDQVVNGNQVWSEWLLHGTRSDGSTETLAGTVILTVGDDGRALSSRFYLDPVE